jgi:hypothetical protein
MPTTSFPNSLDFTPHHFLSSQTLVTALCALFVLKEKEKEKNQNHSQLAREEKRS